MEDVHPISNWIGKIGDDHEAPKTLFSEEVLLCLDQTAKAGERVGSSTGPQPSCMY
jgi:hypothetical protein